VTSIKGLMKIFIHHIIEEIERFALLLYEAADNIDSKYVTYIHTSKETKSLDEH